MWPVRNEMTRDECRKCLRCLELDAYGSMVSVLRAQGPFTSEKQKLLQELAKVLHISNERHRAEVRRAVNDEKLAMIAEQLNGPNTGTDWTIEGRRAIPLLPRLKARSAFTTLANSLSLATTVANEKKPPAYEEAEESKDDNESQIELNTEKNISANTEFLTAEKRLRDERFLVEEVSDSEKSYDTDNDTVNHNIVEHCPISEKRKSPSPLPTAPRNKVLLVSSNSMGKLNHGTVDEESLENDVHLSQVTANSLSHQNMTVIPVNISCSESAETKDNAAQGNASNHTFIQASKYISTVTSICTTNMTKSKGRTTAAPNKTSTKVTPTVLLSGNVSVVSASAAQSDIHDTQDGISSKILSAAHTLQNIQNTDNSSSTMSNIKRVTPVTHSNAKPAITKSITSNNSHLVMTMCPGTTVSSGPGPPKQTATVTCKKLPTTLNHQTTAKMGVTLNSNKTVNISHHPNAKLASKTNVILIQKGHTKGVTLSHAGKEVLGKVIMGGKNLCVTSQHNTSSISVLPHHIAFNNGDQAVTMLSTTNSSHTESVKTNIKPGNTIVFNLRQDVLEKNKVFSQILESSSVLTSEPKTVIHTNACSLKEQTNNDLHIHDKDSAMKADTMITTIEDEKQQRKSKGLYTNANSDVINSIDPSKCMGNKEILISSSQLTNTQDDIISNIEIEDTICRSEIDVYDTSLGSRDIHLENFQYLVEGTENHVVRETRSPILSISHVSDHTDS